MLKYYPPQKSEDAGAGYVGRREMTHEEAERLAAEIAAGRYMPTYTDPKVFCLHGSWLVGVTLNWPLVGPHSLEHHELTAELAHQLGVPADYALAGLDETRGGGSAAGMDRRTAAGIKTLVEAFMPTGWLFTRQWFRGGKIYVSRRRFKSTRHSINQRAHAQYIHEVWLS